MLYYRKQQNQDKAPAATGAFVVSGD